MSTRGSGGLMGMGKSLVKQQCPMTGGSRARSSWRSLLMRAGLLGFLFFLVKGLLWLAVPYVLFVIGTGN